MRFSRRRGQCQINTDEGNSCVKDAVGFFDNRGVEYQCCAAHGEESVRMGGAEEFVPYDHQEVSAS